MTSKRERRGVFIGFFEYQGSGWHNRDSGRHPVEREPLWRLYSAHRIDAGGR
jgi:hypothetical protein